ncbi:MAG: hypothetical protein COX82_01830 [Candidatus Magasanikbacteria bacterium CG_4_10_14_0_2_um_filter_41_10]|uniref:Uncharacterized protein n=1 Tax=Candidatus Magasanikbacteria bacterium CG_4_10_14_0_2_um_filter_41_10 TaxID=1974638 RepID=A0A2M7V5H6_9BACT|nr:MAG: hypothetical protein COX82_01830 [Candidatus Magasanikbacteria bacterium CG_4_10_14_0_2_um_filter_41_10]
MNKLPIEEYPELLTEYGRAFAWLNSMEDYLNIILLIKGRFQHIDVSLKNTILDEMMMGKKITLCEPYLSNTGKLVSKLRQLNDDRVLLAHGITGEQVDIKAPMVNTGNILIMHKQKQHPFTEEFLQSICQRARDISIELHKQMNYTNK